MTGEEILEQVRKLTGDHVWSGYQEINDAYETMCRRSRYWEARQRDEYSVRFQDGVIVYTLPMSRIRVLESVWVRYNDDYQEWRELTEASDATFEQSVLANRGTDGTDTEDVPDVYRLEGPDQMRVSPTPDGSYSVRLVYIGNPAPITRTATPILPESYHRIIAKLAAVNVLRLPPLTEEKGNLAARYDKEVQMAYLNLAFDSSINRSAGPIRPLQRIMRV